MSDLAWMKTYIGDEAAATAHLSPEEFGAYERLRRYYWQHDHLPDDDIRLSRIAGADIEQWTAIRPAVERMFEAGWRLPKLDLERVAASDKRERAIERSQKAAQARWGKVGANAPRNATSIPTSNAYAMRQAMPVAMLEQCPPAPAPDEVRNDEGLAPTRVHARETDSFIPIPRSEEEGLALLKANEVFPPDYDEFLAKLMAGTLRQSELEVPF